MCKQKITENEKRMQIANCRICLLCKSHCADCPLNWALKIIENENPLKVIEPEVIEIDVKSIERQVWMNFATRYLENVPNGAKQEGLKMPTIIFIICIVFFVAGYVTGKLY